MFHPLIRLIASKPHLLAQHLGGYADLAAAQAADTAQSLQTRLLLSVALAGCLLVGLITGGMALLLTGALPLATMPQPWLLAVVPALPLAAAAALAIQLRSRPVASSWHELRLQFEADLQLMQDAGER